MTDGVSDNNKSAVDPSEPSMEDILASIRQLITDDNNAKLAGNEDAQLDVAASLDNVINIGPEADAPLELTSPVDDNEDILSGLMEADVTAPALSVPALTVPEIDTRPAEADLTPKPKDDVELPVESLLDDIIGQDSVPVAADEAIAEDLPQVHAAEAELSIEDLMEDFSQDNDVAAEPHVAESNEPSSSRQDADGGLAEGAKKAAAPLAAAAAVAAPLAAMNIDHDDALEALLDDNHGHAEDDIGASIDDILSDLSNDIDIEGDDKTAEVSSSDDASETMRNAADDEADDVSAIFDDEEELGQDFDDLMASFLADDEPGSGEQATNDGPSADAQNTEVHDNDLAALTDEFLPEKQVESQAGAMAAPIAAIAGAVSLGAATSDSSEIDSILNDLLDDDLTSLPENTDVSHDSHAEQIIAPEPQETLAHDEAQEPLTETDDVDNILSAFDSDVLEPELMSDSAQDELVQDDVASRDETLGDVAEDDLKADLISGDVLTPHSDPDIELVKSLMADLTDNPSSDDGHAVEDETDVVSDLLAETISSEEALQSELQSDIMTQIETINDEEPETSSLSELANEIDNNETVDDIAVDDNVDSGGVAGIGAGLAAGTVMASLMAQASAAKPSALDALMGDDGAALETETETPVQHETESDHVIDEVLSGPLSDDADMSPNSPVEFGSDPAAAAEQKHEPIDTDIDMPIADVGDENPVQGESLVKSDDVDIEQATASVEFESSQQVISENSDYDLIADLLAPEHDAPLDPAPETLDIIVNNSELETEDMAVKPARETILDEVTETAAASAFASLNQVVEEKTITAERGDRIGDLVTEALKPMLKDWLDANLKGIVERAVQKEVKRISSGK